MFQQLLKSVQFICLIQSYKYLLRTNFLTGSRSMIEGLWCVCVCVCVYVCVCVCVCKLTWEKWRVLTFVVHSPMVKVALTCRLGSALFFRQPLHRLEREEQPNTTGLDLLLYALRSLSLRLVSWHPQVQEATIQTPYLLTSPGFAFLPKFCHIFRPHLEPGPKTHFIWLRSQVPNLAFTPASIWGYVHRLGDSSRILSYCPFLVCITTAYTDNCAKHFT